MTPAALAALRRSIERWERIVDGEATLGAKDCPLCQEFNSSGTALCAGCPVYEKTGRRFCRETPYYEWIESIDVDTGPGGWQVGGPRSAAAARDELKFLRSLLPPDDLPSQLESLTDVANRRELNARIADHVYGPAKPSGPVDGPRVLVWWNGALGLQNAPDFLGSLDAVIPDEKITSVTLMGNNRWEARGFDAEGNYHTAEGVTEAVARRAAALRARG